MQLTRGYNEQALCHATHDGVPSANTSSAGTLLFILFELGSDPQVTKSLTGARAILSEAIEITIDKSD